MKVLHRYPALNRRYGVARHLEQGEPTLARRVGTLAVRSGGMAQFLLLSALVKARYFRHSPFTRSSYHFLLAGLVLARRPQCIVQLGVGEGVSLVTMGLAQRMAGVDGRLTGYDHFGARPAGEPIVVGRLRRNLRLFGLHDRAEIREADLLVAPCREREIDLLNIDIDNNYERLSGLWERGWIDALADDGLAIIEGGTARWTGATRGRGIGRFCTSLRDRGFEVVFFPAYPGMFLVSRGPVLDASLDA